MKKTVVLKKILKVLRSMLLSAFLLLWSVGMFMGGLYGMAAVICGVPAVIGFTVFE